MRRGGWISLALVVAVVLAVGVVIMKPKFSVGPAVAACYADAAIAPDERRPIEDRARGFVGLLLGASPRNAYAELSTVTRASSNPDQIKFKARQLNEIKEVSPPSVTRTLLIDGLVGAPPGTKVPCGDLRDSGGVEAVAFASAPKEAHVLLTEGLLNAERTFDVWLVFEDGRWRVNGFSFNLSMIGGRGGESLWSEAKEQRARGHVLNAAFLYLAASQTLSRGPYFELPDWAAFSRDYATFRPPAELSGSPPYRWTLGGRTYDILHAMIVGVDKGQVILAIDQPSCEWKGDGDADRRNHQTIDAFIAAHPEWSETFDAIAVRSNEPGTNRFFGSVYRKASGYSEGN
jgi:hypothetical protein